jgi:hypothetical protein
MEQARGTTRRKAAGGEGLGGEIGEEDSAKENNMHNDENVDANLRLHQSNKKSSSMPSPQEEGGGEKEANVFQRLGVYEVLRRREMAKIKAAKRKSIAHYKSKHMGEDDINSSTTSNKNKNTYFERYHQTFLKSGVCPKNASQYLIPQHLDPDECSFNPLITAKAKRLPKRSGEDMSRDALIYSEKRKQLVAHDYTKQAAMVPFKPTLETRQQPETNPSSKFVNKATSTICLKQPTASYIERLKEKAEAKERLKEQLQKKKEIDELEGCTFEPDLPPCPQFIHQLADGFKKAKENGTASNSKKYSEIYEGKNSKYKKHPDWQSVSVIDGSVYGGKWGKVVITDPSVTLATCTRAISTTPHVKPKLYGAFT